jgi:hypothetical protein
MRNKLPLVMMLLNVVGLASAEPVTVHVSGVPRTVNGATEVPVGLFGVHATKLTPEQIDQRGIELIRTIDQHPSGQPQAFPDGIEIILECFFDRYQPALVLSEPRTWEKRLVDLATRYGRSARETGRTHHVEFWNEPYLNWSTKPGVHYDGDHYDTARAVEGGPVHYKGAADPIPHLVWQRGLMAVEAESGKKNYLAWGYAPREIEEDGRKRPVRAGDTYVFREKLKMKFVEHWLVRDTTQKSYWAGRHNVALYNQMLVPFARALKQANPDVQLVAGWDFHLFQGDWDAWHTCFKPTVEASIEWIDGLTEHHYGEDTRRVAASYETIWAYVLKQHGKALKFYNTEAGGMLDPQRPDTPASPAMKGPPLEQSRGRFAYLVRDIVYLIHHSPDKAASRAAHIANHNGEIVGFTLLRDLRGRLIATETEDPRIWCVAALKDGRLRVVIYNDHPEPRDIAPVFTAPAGTRFASGERRQVVEKEDALAIEATAVEAIGDRFVETLALPGKSAAAYVFALSGTPAAGGPAQVETQHPAGQILHRIAAGDAAELKLSIPADAIARATDAALKVCIAGGAEGATAEVNGSIIPLDGAQWIFVHPVDRQRLMPETTIRFRAGGQPLAVDMASIVTIERTGE